MEESSRLLIRKKRIIDRTRYESHEEPVPMIPTIYNVPYIVEIQKNGIHVCGGTILSANVIITAVFCVFQSLQRVRYIVKSGSTIIGAGRSHSVLEIRRHPSFSRFRTFDGNFALLTIFPPIDLVHSPNRKIPLYNATMLLPPRTPVTVSGWGRVDDCRIRRFGEGYHFAQELRSISVLTISLDRCRRAHGNDPEITSKVICTHDHFLPRHCSYGDDGGPLVINENGHLNLQKLHCCTQPAFEGIRRITG
ncbi:transmembrane protease serine 4-like isoform X2 [Belonocnema kinseyi]|uniref:transmembrane protease serine 4-like isoform X2 n=1 Tax=Belonocnema kinseyi TaxID=2817044 RepID=UPI00143CD00B|nr:transmembrane protease serine 4-like isoform X2 [Belonocnema kinseyi]